MSKKFLFFLLASILVLGGAGCDGGLGSPANENQEADQTVSQETGDETSEVVAEEETISPAEGEEEGSVGNVDFVPYTNKTMGYTIDRPDRWYWRHWNKKEIGNTSPGVVDYFITDRAPLPRLGSEYLGRMVIEVSEKNLEELAENVSDLTSSDAMVGGLEAKKFEGTRDNEMVKNQKVIAYHFQKDGQTFRIVYARSNSTAEEEAVFEHLVSSLKFEE